ncbi:MAG: DUF4037 domain-containing protein [Agromyces sp.]
MTSSDFTGIDISRAFFTELVGPVLESLLPEGSFAAGRLGAGSDVLGLDDETSRDHDWGLRLSVFVAAEDQVAPTVHALDDELPAMFRGLPIRFAFTGESGARHHVDVLTVSRFVSATIGFDPSTHPPTSDWLSVTGQAALEVTAGPVFFDGSGELSRARDALSWYPDDVWRYVVACDWARLAQEMPFMGRAADVGDEIGSRLISARLAQIVMHLTFLLERRWPPYSKWFGTLWSTLPGADDLRPALKAMLTGADHASRENGAAAALEVLLSRQKRLGLSDAPLATVPFWDRPYLHPAPEIAEQLMAGISDQEVRSLPLGLGSIEQRTDNVDLLVRPQLRRRFVREGRGDDRLRENLHR